MAGDGRGGSSSWHRIAVALPMSGIAPEVAEGGDGPVTARVAVPTTSANGCRAGVGGVGDGELGGGEDRLAGGLAEGSGDLGEAGVLALVVVDDPVEAVARIE